MKSIYLTTRESGCRRPDRRLAPSGMILRRQSDLVPLGGHKRGEQQGGRARDIGCPPDARVLPAATPPLRAQCQ